MKLSHTLASSAFGFVAASLAVSAGANAAILCYSGAQSYMTKVVSGVTRTYSAIDVFVDCDNAADYIVNFYGVEAKKSFVGTVLNGVSNSATATNATAANGVLFNQGTGTNKGWAPDYDNTDGWFDSFVTIGGRTQDVAGNPDSGNGLAKDPSFANYSSSTSGFGTLRTGTTSTTDDGPGWYSADPNNAMNKAGTYADLKIMLGHFVVDVTSYLGTSDTLTLTFNGNITIKVGGVTQQQPQFAKSFHFLQTGSPPDCPAPGAVAVLGLVGLVSRRRRIAKTEGMISHADIIDLQ
jgi:MYXO-CTERM domain-containing protein